MVLNIMRIRYLVLFFYGLGMFWKGLGFVFKHRLAWIFLFPLALNFLLWWIGFRSTGQLTQWVMDLLVPYLPVADEAPKWVAVLLSVFKWIVFAVFRFLLFLLMVYLGGYVVLMALVPVLSYISALTLRIVAGVDTPFSFIGFVHDVWRGVLLSVRNIVFELVFNILFLIAAFVPIVGWASPFAIFLNSAYFYGISFLDYGLEQHKYGYRRSILFWSSHRALAVGVGTMFALCLLVPFVGVFLCGFVAVVSVVGGTLAVESILSGGDGGGVQNFSAKKLMVFSK